jgi:hypothetical protein
MTTNNFSHFYARQRLALGVQYRTNEFLYPNNEPWPETSFDYPYGQAPTVSNLPDEERKDWQENVGNYYMQNALGTEKHPSPFGFKSAEFARDRFEKYGIAGYAPLTDEHFTELITESLYSKYLGLLDPADEALFGVKDDANYQYLKSDQSCMRVVEKPWEGEYVAPAIAIVRRKLPLTDDTKWNYELVAIALADKNDKGKYEFSENLVFDAKKHQSSSAWWLAKYFVLQGAIHRINLVDHIKVHFPSDTINAITKSVFPRWHPVQQLLMPHFRLTLPVDNVVLEGDRSIINRNTWYPWSPVVANGEEIRKLIPFSWAGSKYYWDGNNTSYPRYGFSLDPDEIMDPDNLEGGPIKSFIGLDASRYGEYLKDYYKPILSFVRDFVNTLPDPTSSPEQEDIIWLEIQRWAHEISKYMPLFPDEIAICDKEVLTKVLAIVIWNAAIVHTSDHSVLHMMIDTDPVPFIIRVRPPASNDTVVEETIAEALGEKGVKYLTGAVKGIEDIIQRLLKKEGGAVGFIIDKLGDKLISEIEEAKLTEGSVPLCWPTDLIYTKMADLLFYRPHSTTLIYDCEYEFLIPEDQLPPKMKELRAEWVKAGRPVLTEAQQLELQGLRDEFQGSLMKVNAKYYNKKGEPVLYGSHKEKDIPAVMNKYGFPKLIPGTDDKDVAETRMECCLTAGIQY